MKDTQKRSFVKGICWRVLASLDTFIIAFILFDTIKIAAPIALTEVFSKILLYYLHERIWNCISWGRKENTPTHFRSALKGISYRCLGTIDTIIISFIYSGSPLSSLKMGLIEIVTKVGLFYIHERLWSHIKWGRLFEEQQKPIEADIKSQIKSW